MTNIVVNNNFQLVLTATGYPQIDGQTIQSIDTASSTKYTVTLVNGRILDFTGTGLTFDGSNNLTGGTITNLIVRDNSATAQFQLGALNLTAANVNGDTVTADALAGDDSITTGTADDTLFALGGNDTVDGGDGDDLLAGGAGDDSLIGGIGADRTYGQGGNDTMTGGTGADQMFGNADNDSASGGDGNDTLRGQVGDDTILGEADDDVLFGGGGSDSVVGGAGSDTVNGNSGSDTVSGGDSADTVRGQGGNDMLFGGAGSDQIVAHAGFDTVDGGTGNDTIVGGPGNDQLTGGDGADSFVFAEEQGADTITDFTPGTDTITISPVSDAIDLDSFADLTITDITGGTRITFEDTPTTSITLTGVTRAQLDADDFIIL